MNEYDLARKLAVRMPYVPEVAVVVSVSPLTLQLGNATYGADKWRIYEAYVSARDVTLNNAVVNGTDSEGGSIHVQPSIGVGSLVIRNHYEVGDTLAVQQVGANTFIVLAKLRRVM